MREIKFRKWNLKEMDYSPDIWADGEGGVLVNYFFGNDDDGIWMQYTGLKDKNGVEIFEGDVIRFIYGEGPGVSSDGNDVIDAWCKEEVSEVTFSQGAFLIGEHLMWALDGMGMDYSIEVVGNIYENPELLEKRP